MYVDLPPNYERLPASTKYIWGHDNSFFYIYTLDDLNTRLENEVSIIKSKQKNIEYDIEKVSNNIYILQTFYQLSEYKPFVRTYVICGDDSESFMIHLNISEVNPIELYSIFKKSSWKKNDKSSIEDLKYFSFEDSDLYLAEVRGMNFIYKLQNSQEQDSYISIRFGNNKLLNDKLINYINWIDGNVQIESESNSKYNIVDNIGTIYRTTYTNKENSEKTIMSSFVNQYNEDYRLIIQTKTTGLNHIEINKKFEDKIFSFKINQLVIKTQIQQYNEYIEGLLEKIGSE